MELKRFEKDVEIIQKLGTYPNRDNGLSSEGLKKKFDEAPALIKEYLNEELVPAFEDMASTVGGGDFLRYKEQNLTSEQQEQARKNIDALKVPRGIARELFFFGEYDDFQTFGNQRIYKIAGYQDWLNSPADFDFRVRFNIARNIGQVEEYEFTKSDCTIIETVQGRKHWQFFANVSGSSSLVLTVANGIEPVSFESEAYCSFIYPSALENYSVEFFKLSETEQELNLVTSVNGIQADEHGNVNIDVGGGSGGGADGFSPVAKVTQTDTGAIISITDKEGTTTATVANGKDGAQGIQGIQGVRGRGILIITSKPFVNTEVANGTTPPYKVSMTSVMSQAGVTKDDILVGDIIESNGEHYKVLALGNGRVYLDNPVTIKGADGKSAYAYAQEAGYTGTETEFANKLASDSSGGVTSWNDLTDKPFYAINPTFNGVLTGREVFPLNDYVNLVKITDIILKEEDCVGKTVTTMSTDGINTFPVTNKGIIDTTSMYGVPSFAVTADELVDAGFFLVCIIKEPSTAAGIYISAGTYYLYYSEIGLYASYFSVFDDMKLVKTLDSKYLPDYLPSIEVVDSTFDGDLTGRETVFVQEGTYAVKVSTEYVTVAQLIGATLAVDMQGTEQTMTLTAETAMDSTSILGVSGAVVLQGTDPIVLSLAEDSTIQGATFTAGTWFMCVPGSFYVKSLSCLFSGETIRKMDERCLPDNVATKEYVEEVILGGAW